MKDRIKRIPHRFTHERVNRLIGSLAIIISLVLLTAPLIIRAMGPNLIIDGAGLLTKDEYAELNERALEISQRYECDVAIITVGDMGYGDSFGYADSVRKEKQMGYGAEGSIILLFLSMAERDYALLAYGYGNTAFTDHGKDVMLDKYILPLLGKDKYYGAFSKYLDLGEEYLEKARNGEPFDIENDSNYGKIPLPIKLGIIILIPVLIAAIICGIWKRQMKTAVLAKTASNYITPEGLKLTNRQDLFLYRTVIRRKIETQPTRSSGGTTINKSGTSGRSGKF